MRLDKDFEERVRAFERELGVPPSQGVSITYMHKTPTDLMVDLLIKCSLATGFMLLLRHMFRSASKSAGIKGMDDALFVSEMSQYIYLSYFDFGF